MRIRFGLALLGVVGGAGTAAAQPMDPYAPSVSVQLQAPDVQPIDPYAVPIPPPPPPLPPPPPGAYPAPPAYGYQPPVPGRYQSAPPAYQQGYYLYPGNGGPPVYYAPPPRVYSPYYRPRLQCAQLCAEPRRKPDGVRRFSLGAHGTVLGLNQTIGGKDMVLSGAGFQLRLRSRGRFGFEAKQSFLHAEYWNGGFVRNSFPFSLSLMFYIFPNQDTRHFNLYALAGLGFMPDSVELYDQNRRRVEQDFLEFEMHLGIGAELRFKWFAIEADVRGMGLFRDDRDTPASYYAGVSGGPIPERSWGVSGNVYLSLWF